MCSANGSTELAVNTSRDDALASGEPILALEIE
jgi:hypothetical protein